MNSVDFGAAWFLTGLSLGFLFAIIEQPLMNVLITLVVIAVVIRYDE